MVSTKKIIDTFLFFNEIELLKVRLSYLGDHVENFFIVESNCDFSGKIKPFYLENHLHEMPFAEKIIYYKLKINFNSYKWIIKRLRWFLRKPKFLWKIQDAQRNALSVLIKDYPLNYDYILFGDLDEIPNKNFLMKLKKGQISLVKPHILYQRCFYYNYKFASPEEDWPGTLCSPKDIFFDHKPSVWRHIRQKLDHQSNGGFHFSYFMPPHKIIEKINAIAEVEKLEEYLNLNEREVINAILTSQDIFGRNLGFVNQSGLIPADLMAFLESYLPYLITEK